MKQSADYTYGGLLFCPYREGDDHFKVSYTEFESRLYVNEATGHKQFHPMPPSELLDQYYNGAFTRSVVEPAPDSEFRSELIEVVRGVRNYIKDVARIENFSVHDIGCGFGAGVWAWQQIGVLASGNESNRKWVDAANPYCKHLLSAEPLDVALKALGRKVDMFFSSHVLEHLPDPLATIQTVAEHMSENGVFYICVPNGHAHRVMMHGRRDGLDFSTMDGTPNFPMHLNFFTPTSMFAILRAGGLEPIRVETRPLDETTEKANDKAWRNEVLTNLHGGELFVLACKPGNKLALRQADIDALAREALTRFLEAC